MLVALASLGTMTVPAWAELSLEVLGSSVEASGVTPGASVVWLGLSRPDLEFETVFVTHRTQLTDSDNNGVVTFTPESGIPWKSVFVAVDLANLASAVAAPADFEFPLTALPIGLAASDVSGPLNELRLSQHSAEVLVARLVTGAFGLTGWDGGDTDGDGEANDSLVFPAAQLDSLGAAPPSLTSFQPGDLIVVIDPEQMGVNLFTVPEVTP